MNINYCKMNEMKASNIFCTVLLILVCGCAEYPAYVITNTPFVNETSLNMYIGDEVQLTASPVDENFVWSSDNEKVASVTQTGLVTAISEGLSSITVKSSNDEVRIDVRVRTFIPLTDINLSKTSAKLYAGDKAQIWAYSIPEDASDVKFTWRSENPDVATVDKDGIVTAVSRGVTNIIVSYGSIEKNVTVSVPELYKCDKTGWTVEVSDQQVSDGGGKDKMIDNDYGTGEFWHSQYIGNFVYPPHWAVIDMKEPVEIARIVTQRRINGDTKTLQYFVGDSPNPNADTWVKVVEGAYISTSANHTLTLDVEESVTGRYLKLILPDSFRPPYTAICEVDVYGLMY
jgi:hypothetical protein